MNTGMNSKLKNWAKYLFYMVPVLAASYIALILVPAAAARWPVRFISWQELSLLMLVIVFCLASARPLYRLRNSITGAYAGLNGVAVVLSLFAMVGCAMALILQSGRWVVGAFLIGAALPPLVHGLKDPGRDKSRQRFNM
jgi:hypothetical protein